VVDVLVDDDLDQQHRQDVARRPEQPLVVPAGVLARQRVREAVVLAQEQHAEHREPELQVRRVAAHGEQPSRCSA
jgi:hypothetical protein